MTGIVKSLPHSKHFGFVSSGGVEYFFHHDDFHGHWDDLVEDYVTGVEIQVTFRAVDIGRGPRAVDVKRVDGGRFFLGEKKE